MMFFIAAGAILINIFSSIDFSLSGADSQWLVLLEMLKRVLFLLLLILGMAIVLLRSSQQAQADDRPAPWILWAKIAAIAIFLIHNLVDFSFFEPGPMCLLAMLSGAALGIRGTPQKSGPIFISIATLCATTAFIIAAALGIIVPISISEAAAQRANDDLRDGRAALAATELKNAFDSLWIPNADLADRAAEVMEQANLPAAQVLAMYDAAVADDPMSVRYLLHRAEFEFRQPQPDAASIIRDFEKIVQLDPNQVSQRLEFAGVLLRFGHRQQAVEQFQAALHYNDLLELNDPKRLTQAQIESIQRQIKTSD
jgi:tetratricopeptide (TPR) repeat protein